MMIMKICGLQKTTLLDYPGHVAATIFLGGCNFRCPFCHNKDLLGDNCKSAFSQEEVLDFLKKRASILEGVCITGGEPTLHLMLELFIRQIRQLGYLVKLDTNGYRPEVLKDLCSKQLIDYVAMDIKTCRENYAAAAGVSPVHISLLEESVDFLMTGDIPYEFRTTVVKELHTTKDFQSIGRWLTGAGSYYLQNYTDSDQVLHPGFTSCTKEELLGFRSILKPYLPHTELRGVDYE